jgi:lysosome membrane protein 2
LAPDLKSVGGALLQQIINDAGAHIYVCQLATNLAFNYSDNLVQRLNSDLVLKAFNLSYPRTYVSIQFNNSANNSLPSTINTGAKDINSIGQYVQWQGNVEELMVWPNGMGANDINGTEGFFFHPFLQEGEEIEIFVDDIYRSLRLKHVDTINLMGIEVFRFALLNSTLQSAFTNPENARWGSWNPDGLFYLGPTQDPVVPVFGSKPHFLDGDPDLLEKVDGLRPDRELHESYLDVQPSIGTNVQVGIKLQVNAQVNQSTMVK